MNTFKDYFKKLYKSVVQKIFSFFFSPIKIASNEEVKKLLSVEKIAIDKITYKIFKNENCRLYTTSVHDQAVIVNNKLIPGPSFQLRTKIDDTTYARNNGNINENIVLKIGTPRVLKKIRGKVFSLLSGGAAKTNYFHWLFEILPKLEILNNLKKINEIDYFLLPSIRMQHQLETLRLLNIPKKKLIDSNKYKHFFCNELYNVDHPFRLTNNTVYDTQNIPSWIFFWIKKKFLQYKSNATFPDKIFIDRPEAISASRDIKNKEEVYKFFKDKKFEFIQPESFSFRDQIQIFFSAKKIAGLHGAGFANICFCKPETEIIEFKTITTGMNSGNIALKTNLNYRGIICDAVNKLGGQQGKLIVPLDQLKNDI